LASLYLRVGKSDQAIATMRRAIEELGSNPDLLNAFGLMLASLGREEESREQFEAALALDCHNTEALRNLAFTMHRRGDREQAYNLLVQCFHATPLSVELRLICGTLLELDGNVDDAVCCYREVVELSMVTEQMRLASQRLLFLDVNQPDLPFEEIIRRLEHQVSREA
jgi:tetratricopeptide (TPR) repeat protein